MSAEKPTFASDVRPDPLEAALERAQRWFDAQRYDRAEQDLTAALALDPKNVYTHIMLARCAIARSNWERAEEHAGAAAGLAPDAPHTLGLLAVIAVERGRFSDAETRILEALRLDPEEAWLYEIYGDIMRVTGHSAKARKLYERGLRFAPEDASLHSKLALVATNENEGAKALVHARAGLAEDSEGTLAHAANGAALLAGGRPFAARRAFREALRLDPSNAHLEEAWRETDRCCRVVYLPMFYWTFVISRLPGKQFGVWALFVAFTLTATKMGVPQMTVGVVAIVYVAFALYTWIASPLVNLWVKIRPARWE